MLVVLWTDRFETSGAACGNLGDSQEVQSDLVMKAYSGLVVKVSNLKCEGEKPVLCVASENLSAEKFHGPYKVRKKLDADDAVSTLNHGEADQKSHAEIKCDQECDLVDLLGLTRPEPPTTLAI